MRVIKVVKKAKPPERQIATPARAPLLAPDVKPEVASSGQQGGIQAVEAEIRGEGPCATKAQAAEADGGDQGGTGTQPKALEPVDKDAAEGGPLEATLPDTLEELPEATAPAATEALKEVPETWDAGAGWSQWREDAQEQWDNWDWPPRGWQPWSWQLQGWGDSWQQTHWGQRYREQQEQESGFHTPKLVRRSLSDISEPTPTESLEDVDAVTAQLQRCNTGMQCCSPSPSPSPVEVSDKNKSNAEHLAHLSTGPVVGAEEKRTVEAPTTPERPPETRTGVRTEEAEKARLEAEEEEKRLEAARLEAEIDADMEKLGKELEEFNAKEGVTEKEKADAAKKTKQKLDAHARYMRYSRCVNSRLGLSSSNTMKRI